MSHVIILAGSATEANAYRRDHALPKGRSVHASSARQIEGVVPSEIHTLPGFAKRRDQHAIKAALKRAARKYQGIRYVTFDERGFLTDRVLEVAYRYNALREIADLGSDEPIPEEQYRAVRAEVAEERRQEAGYAELAKDPEILETRRLRRSRCKDCGALHLKGDPCEPPADPTFFG